MFDPKYRWQILLTALSLTCSPQLWADAGSNFPVAGQRSPVEDTYPVVPPPRFQFQVDAGFQYPTGDAITTVYGASGMQYGASFGYAIRPDLIGSVGFSVGQRSGTAVGKTSLSLSGETTEILLVPIELNATWQIRPLALGLMIPYVKGGLNLCHFRETVLDETLGGGILGLHARVGAAFRVDSGPNRPWAYDSGRGIQGIWAVLEAGYTLADRLGPIGLDLSGAQINLGVYFEF